MITSSDSTNRGTFRFRRQGGHLPATTHEYETLGHSHILHFRLPHHRVIATASCQVNNKPLSPSPNKHISRHNILLSTCRKRLNTCSRVCPKVVPSPSKLPVTSLSRAKQFLEDILPPRTSWSLPPRKMSQPSLIS